MMRSLDKRPTLRSHLSRLAIAIAIAAAGTMLVVAAQEPERYRGRLSILPVEATAIAISLPSGEVTADVRGRELRLTASFTGLRSPITGAEIRHAPKGRRGEVVLTVAIGSARGTGGRFSDTLTLNATQLAELRQERYYLQIRTADHPDGEIRGWLLASE